MIFDIGRFASSVRTDLEFRYKLKNLMAAVARLELPAGSIDVVIADGAVVDVRPAANDADVLYSAPREFWDRLAINPPPPGYESATGGSFKGLTVKADVPSLLAPFHPAWERLFTLYCIALRGPVVRSSDDPEPFRDTDTAVGRYIHIPMNGTMMRVYYETAGTGPVPLLFQHTAGCDARQWRHQLADPELQRDYTMIAYDLPYHGKSLPPTSVEWWSQDYVMSQKGLMDAVVAISVALKLDRPIFIGCSVGGQLALDLAAFHADQFRGFVSLNGWHDGAPFAGFSNDVFRNALISENWYSSSCLGSTSPMGNEANRQETYWIYRSNYPGVYAGDNDYFMSGHDLRRDGHLIDAMKTKVYVLNGEYDASVHFDASGGAAVARNIPGVVYREMAGQSHFAPSDDPLGFRKELIPVLKEIVEG